MHPQNLSFAGPRYGSPATSSEQKSGRGIRIFVCVLALLKFILPFLLQNGSYDPHRDEFLYLAEGRHMAWGFMEVPPLLSVFAWLVHLCGDGMFWIKCWPSLFGAFTFVIVAQIIVILGGRYFAVLLGALPFLTGAYLRGEFLFQPNFLEAFFWTLMAFSLVAFAKTRRNRWLYLFGIAAGLGMLSKYAALFYITGLLLGLLLGGQASIFRNKHFYFAALIGLLLFLPNLLWQYAHGFPVVFHMNELRKTQLQYVSASGFLVEQLLFNLPTLFVWLTGLFATILLRAYRPYRFIGLAYFVVIGLLLAGHGKGYYALGLYPSLIAFGALQLEKITTIRIKWLRWLLVAIPVALGIYILPILLPVLAPEKLAAFYQRNHTAKTGALKWEDLKDHPLPQDFADMLGWKEMAAKTGKAWSLLTDEEKKHTLLFCDNYGQAGAVNYYSDKFGLPEAFSDNASFLYWMPEKFTFDNLVLVTDDEHEMEHAFIRNFRSAVLVDSVSNKLAREHGSLILLLKGADTTFMKFFVRKIDTDKVRARLR